MNDGMGRWTSDQWDDFNEGYGTGEQEADNYAPMYACEGFFLHLLNTGWMPLTDAQRTIYDTADPAWRRAYAHRMAEQCHEYMTGGYAREPNIWYVRPKTGLTIGVATVPTIDYFYLRR